MPDMRLTSEERKDFSTPRAHAPKYPYGLRITLDQEQIDKLNLMKMPGVDDEFKFHGEVKVVAVRSVENEEGEGGEKHSIELQITELYLKEDKEEKPSAAQVIYGE